ncbi:MAG: hypothetical protein EHM47_19160 [Ignavibacteriales bacterium]|nr:MAG: hypothetical protein EHM47_19160 [Ignavibacteriales bacterium]
MKNLFVLSGIALSLLLSACSENSTGPSDQDSVYKSSVQSKSYASAEAEVYNDDTAEAELLEREVTITMPNGALVKFHYYLGEIREVEGLTGPYDYELKIAKGYIDYGDARKIALEAVKGDINYWKFEKDKSTRMAEFRFIILNRTKNEVRINAATGELIK